MIRLRDVSEGDRDRLFEWRNLPDVRRWMYTDHVIQRSEHDAWFDAMLVDPTRKYWVILLDDDPVGVVNLVGLDPGTSSCSFGLYIGEQHAIGVGAARRALEVAVDYAFDQPGIERVTAETLVGNLNAERLYLGIGMSPLPVALTGPKGKKTRAFKVDRADWTAVATRQESLR